MALPTQQSEPRGLPEIHSPLTRSGELIVQTVRDMEVHLQSSDASINLKALVSLAVLDKRVENPMDEMRRVRMDLHGPASPYISFRDALQLCSHYHLLGDLWPILSFGIALRAQMLRREQDGTQETAEASHQALLPTLTGEEFPVQYLKYNIKGFDVFIDTLVMRVDIRQLARAAEIDPNQLMRDLEDENPDTSCVVKMIGLYPGLFYPGNIVIQLCRRLRFVELARGIHAVCGRGHHPPALPPDRGSLSPLGSASPAKLPPGAPDNGPSRQGEAAAHQQELHYASSSTDLSDEEPLADDDNATLPSQSHREPWAAEERLTRSISTVQDAQVQRQNTQFGEGLKMFKE